ncbi:hypothetical protein AWB81_06253 [Caballeronia arationis]|nr:hypothetical protein AWB81_06253 [Caballeronia arationis]
MNQELTIEAETARCSDKVVFADFDKSADPPKARWCR